ncbi:MAG: 2-dehydro-3-deoxyglucarate aldolase [Candidatus Latescibacteria bacterium]|jgi:4-hydroxy-2-oxoheptanedioate aldolase|nr:2-dehydro-3-deoxyglucarate aldolase [Candidatus Latescibacterota bacterium]MBT5830976.1 2-dehydro-3-deoxyglucarate aldolase [Candidatus Latescibacterota bacterium]
MLNSIRERVLDRELLTGTFLNLGSSLTVEMAGRSGFDWLLLDVEHGGGSHSHLIHQIQAAGATPAAPIVRIENNAPPRFKRVLDLGASGIMVPYVSSVEEAELAVSSMRYPPRGIRGVAKLNRGSAFGAEFEEYFTRSHELLTTIVQIETAEALDNLEGIAAIDGVDVLFVGPMDLSVNMGIREQFDHPDFIAARKKVADVAKNAGKAAGILLLNPDQVPEAIELGYTFVALGSDGGLINTGMHQLASQFDAYR